MLRRWDVKGRSIVITGASSGIGAATAAVCAQAGMDVAVGARRKDRLDQTVEKIESYGVRGLAVECDVTQDGQVHQLLESAYERFGRVDAVFCNAGVGLESSVLDTTDEQMKYLFDVNYYGTIRTVHAAVPFIRRTIKDGAIKGPSSIRGQIIICSSVVSELGLPFYGAYCATKAAQDAIASSLRAELAGEKIWVSSVHPIGTRTEFFEVAGAKHGQNTHKWLIQSSETVAKAVLRGIRYPKVEIWPHWPTRIGLAICTALPSAGAKFLRHMASRPRD